MSEPNWLEVCHTEEEREKKLGYNFTENWFHGGIKYDIDRIVKLDKESQLDLLEIGAFEGRSSVWFIDTYLTHPQSSMIIVDPFLTSDSTTDVTDKTFDLFKENVDKSQYPQKVTFYKMKSEDVIPSLLISSSLFDLIFIDGSHLMRDVIFDVVNCWKMLKKGGYFILDDYNNTTTPYVRKCVDFFLSCYEESEYAILHTRYQIIIRKN